MRFPSASSSIQCAQGRLHRIGIGVVAVVDELNAVDFADLQARFRQRALETRPAAHSSSESTEGASSRDREHRILHHVQSRDRQVARGSDALLPEW